MKKFFSLTSVVYSLLLIIFFNGSAYCFAQTSLSKQTLHDNNASRFLLRLSPDEGLSQSYVTKTIQDQQGFIWIATDMGLNRYDGYQVQQISGPNNIFLKESISTLFLDQQGYLWVSTLYSGLYRLNTKTFASKQFFSGKFTQESSEIAEVITIKQASATSLWLGISGRVYLLDIPSGKLTHYLTLKTKDHIVRDLLEVGDWLFCATSQGMYRINIMTKQVMWFEHRPKNIRDEDSVNSKFLYRDDKLGLLVGTVNGLFSLTNYLAKDDKKIQSKQLISNLNIWRMIAVGNKFLLATDKGLYQYDKNDHQLAFVLKFSDSIYQITDDNIIDLMQDNTGNIWLASRSQGVMRWSPLTQRFHNISASTTPKLTHDNVWAIFNDNKYLWVGTDNGLNRLNLTSNEVKHYLVKKKAKSNYGDHVIRNIFANNENDNLLWLVTDLGLKIFNKSTGKLKTPYYNAVSSQLIKNQWINGYSVVSNSKIFFFTDIGHYIYNSKTGVIKSLTVIDKATPVELSWSFLSPIDDDNILLTTSGHLYQYNLSSQQLKLLYKAKNYQPQNYDYVDNYALDKDGILWLTVSGEGLVGIDYQSLKEKYRFDTTNGLTTNAIYSVQVDAFNNLWLSSQKGLFRLDRHRDHIENFTSKDGLFANEFNGGAVATLQDRRLVYGSTRGIVLFSPEQFLAPQQRKSNFNVVISGVDVFSDEHGMSPLLLNDNNIVLNYDDYGLKLYFSTLQYLQQDKTKYTIDLTGPAPLHFTNITKNELLLSKLPPGNYQLSIVATNPVSRQQSAPLVLNITSLQAPWLSLPAKLTYLLIIFMLVYSYIHIRNSQRKKLEQEHEKLLASQSQIQLALNASNSGIWDYQLDKNLRFESYTGEEIVDNIQQYEKPLSEHFALIHPDERENIVKQWQTFLKQEDAVWDVNFRMKVNDKWQWYRETGAVITRDKNGKPERVSGTFTNITQEKASDAQMLLYGAAFKEINDWVLILDNNKIPLTANKAFMKMFADESQQQVPSLKHVLTYLGEQKYQQFKEIISRITLGKSWQGEETIKTKQNHQHPVLVKINAVSTDNNEQITHYVVVISDISIQKNAEEKLRHLAHYDYLTDLPNRKLILEKIEHVITEHQFCEHRSALFFIDLDKFKQVNDSLGHHAGDELLKHVADTLINNVKSRDLVARQSGDEFMILIENFKSIDDLTHLAQRINQCLSKPLNIASNQVNISSSIGIAIFPDDAINSAELIRKADLAMIHAKELGRSQFQFFTQEMNAKAHRRIELESELMQAVEENSLTNFYQPIVDCESKQVVGFELLMRWLHPDGMISPAEFIPVSEEIGLISKMTEQALARALVDYLPLAKAFPQCYISVNLSAIHILQQGLCNTLKTLLDEHQLPTSILRLEITEGTLLVDKKTALMRLQELKAAGFKLLLDDFGTGYSSLTYLSQFPIDVIKIDQSFVRHLQNNPMNKPIIEAIISLANSLGLSCVAEGVEGLEQLEYIRSLGCEKIQGYYFSQPMAVTNVVESEHIASIAEKLSKLA